MTGQLVPIVPGEGNAKPPPKQDGSAKNWTMRWSNYPEDWENQIVPKYQANGVLGYIIGQEISPTTGTPHLQGYAQFKERIRWSAFKLPLGIEWQAAKGNLKQNMTYCSKDGEFISWGTCKCEKPYKINIELNDWEDDIVQILKHEPDDRHIYWFWAHEGNKGKTTFQKWIFLNYEGVVVLSGKASDMKNGIINYEERTGKLPTIVLINIPRSQDIEFVSWQGIEEIKDMFFFSGKYEGGMVCGKNPHVLIFSNDEPPLHKLSEDRWVVRQIA